MVRQQLNISRLAAMGCGERLYLTKGSQWRSDFTSQLAGPYAVKETKIPKLNRRTQSKAPKNWGIYENAVH